ncbi:pyrimidine reductase family protein [Glycomyces algeriensis]|uniref:pyrimidine reductase family protein n=1 Tax=Glycomyces algeriensis TaxID=256037 RepID=UPI0022DC425B|nr:pyrimidine reductase family protein [Glycomyces algeriensis]MDA1365338.1 pyrimidine reductase family protein [Glycomyces algeriensis]MDR7349598.1 riboflavin biosynthesis pyrimidine reductase [Glycomyces algeriensis]
MAEVRYRKLDALTDDEVYAAYEPPADDWLRVNFVSSADGAATLEGLSGPLSGEEDKRVFKVLRARCDVLLAGSGTVAAEGYGPLVLSPDRMAWRRAHGLPEVPVMAVASRTLADLDPAAGIFTEAPRRAIVIVPTDLPEAQVAPFREVADVIATGTGAVDYAAAVDALRERGLRQILCEGGPRVFGDLIAADLADELDLTLSPLLAGAGSIRIAEGTASDAARPLELRHVLEAGGNLILRYLRDSTDE